MASSFILPIFALQCPVQLHNDIPWGVDGQSHDSHKLVEGCINIRSVLDNVVSHLPEIEFVVGFSIFQMVFHIYIVEPQPEHTIHQVYIIGHKIDGM